ncbi:MAG: FkbM family methyltransferase [Pseudomonadota bacterium]
MPSQYGQDLFALQLLNGKRDGYFLDTGASDGFTSSNTELLERSYGWSGICVEPNTRSFEKLLQARRCVCLNTCLYDRVADLPFLEAAGTLGGLMEGFGQRQLANAVQRKHLRLDDAGLPPLVTKRTTTLETVLDAARAPPVIDFWSLDTEGTELLLLQSFPFARYTFNVLTVEHNHQPAARAAIRRFLEARGYEFVTALFIDDCYIRSAAFPQRYSHSAVWRRRL